MIISSFQQGVEDLACSLKAAKEECTKREGEWRHLEEDRARLIQLEQKLQSITAEHMSALETMSADETYLSQVYREAQADFIHKEARLQEIRCQTEEELHVAASLSRKLAAMKEERKCVGEPGHYQYLLKEAECDVQRRRKDVEELTFENKRFRAEISHARALVNETHNQLAANNAQAYEAGITVTDL